MADENSTNPPLVRRLAVIDNPADHQYRLSSQACDLRAVFVAVKTLLIHEEDAVESSDELSAALVLVDHYATKAQDLAEEIDEAFIQFRAKLKEAGHA